jgi:hypothetical protein
MTGPGSPFVAYHQSTTSADGARRLHTEAGFIRSVGDDTVEMVVAQATGLVEVLTGSTVGAALRLESQQVGRTPTALAVTQVVRVLEVAGDLLTYQVNMGMNGEAPAPHLSGRLVRVG